MTTDPIFTAPGCGPGDPCVSNPRPPVPAAHHACPLCGGPNGCAPAASGRFDSPCWCRHADFAPALLQQVPAALRGRACICFACAAAAAAR